MKVACAKSVEWARRGMVQKTLHFSLQGFNKETEYARVSKKFTVLAEKFYRTLHVGDVLLTTERLWVLILITARHYGGFNNLLKTGTAKFLTLAAQQALPLLQATSDAQHAAAAPALEAKAPPALEEGEIAGGGKLTEDQVYQNSFDFLGKTLKKTHKNKPKIHLLISYLSPTYLSVIFRLSYDDFRRRLPILGGFHPPLQQRVKA